MIDVEAVLGDLEEVMSDKGLVHMTTVRCLFREAARKAMREESILAEIRKELDDLREIMACKTAAPNWRPITPDFIESIEGLNTPEEVAGAINVFLGSPSQNDG